MVHLVQLDPLELLGHKVNMVFQGLKVKMVILVLRAHLDQLANLESLACQELKEVMEGLVLLDQKGHKVTKEILDQMGLQDHLGMMENMGKEDLLVQRVRKANLAFKEDQAQEDPQGLKDQKETLVHLAFLAILESRAQVVSKESLVILAIMEEKVTEVSREILDLQDNQGCKDLLANLVCQVPLVNKEMLDHLEQKETLAHW